MFDIKSINSFSHILLFCFVLLIRIGSYYVALKFIM